MPKGKKVCSECGQETGARATQCRCGHQFSRPKQTPIIAEKNSVEVKETVQPTETTAFKKASISCPIIYTPSGTCPYKPEGYQKNWPEGPVEEGVVIEWALRVLNSGAGRRSYTVHAVQYWAHEFWDINGENCGKEHKRVCDIIFKTLCPQESSFE
jgi:hypothetical protein